MQSVDYIWTFELTIVLSVKCYVLSKANCALTRNTVFYIPSAAVNYRIFRRQRKKFEFKAREFRAVRRTCGTPQRLRDEAQHRNQSFYEAVIYIPSAAVNYRIFRRQRKKFEFKARECRAVRRTCGTPQRVRDDAQHRNQSFYEAVI